MATDNIEIAKYMANQAERVKEATGDEASVKIEVSGPLGDRLVVSYDWGEETADEN